MRSLAFALLASLSLAACATKKEATPPPPSPELAALPGTPKPPPKKASMSLLGYLWPLNWPKLIFPKKPGPPQGETLPLIGVVKMVNADDHFVLIDAVSYQGLEPGTLLVCITSRQETANLRMSSLRNPPFLIADITSGTPAPGDRVFKP